VIGEREAPRALLDEWSLVLTMECADSVPRLL
jgi:hypothetical protein